VEQLEALEHESDLAIAKIRALVVGELVDGAAAEYSPLEAVSRQPRMLSSVDLPDPDAPTRATISPRSIAKLTPPRAAIRSSPIWK
jgi:hypothetical protein